MHSAWMLFSFNKCLVVSLILPTITKVQGMLLSAGMRRSRFLLGAVPMCRILGFSVLKFLGWVWKCSPTQMYTTEILSFAQPVCSWISFLVAVELAVIWADFATGISNQKYLRILRFIPVVSWSEPQS